MVKLPFGVDINNLIDDLRSISWEACDILLYYSLLINSTDDKREIITSNKNNDPVTKADLKVNELIINRINQIYSNVSNQKHNLNFVQSKKMILIKMWCIEKFSLLIKFYFE